MSDPMDERGKPMVKGGKPMVKRADPMVRRACVGVALSAAIAAGGPALAHHSFAMYDGNNILTMKGEVKTFQWTNPHCVIWIVVKPEGGGEPQEWSVETTSPGVLTRAGWTRNSIKPGDHVSVEMRPLRDGSHGGGLDSVTLTDSGQKLLPNNSFGVHDNANK